MSEEMTTKELIIRRRMTRSTADWLGNQLRDHLSTLTILFRPRSILGDFVSGVTKESARGADATYAEIKSAYDSVASAKPYQLHRDFPKVFENMSSIPEVTPWEYVHHVSVGSKTKKIAITSPLSWTLHYAPYPLGRLAELIQNREQQAEELQRAMIHHLTMQAIFRKQPGLTRLFEALRLNVQFEKLAAFGELPIARVTAAIPTVRPADDILVESTEISGRDAFEEILDPQAAIEIADPWKNSLATIISQE